MQLPMLSHQTSQLLLIQTSSLLIEVAAFFRFNHLKDLLLALTPICSMPECIQMVASCSQVAILVAASHDVLH